MDVSLFKPQCDVHGMYLTRAMGCYEITSRWELTVNPPLLSEVWCRGEVATDLRSQYLMVPYGVINKIVKKTNLFVEANQCVITFKLKVAYLIQHVSGRITL